MDLAYDLPSLAPCSRVIVEAAHIYTNEASSLEHLAGAAEGARYMRSLTHAGHAPVAMLFIDDYHPRFEGAPCVLDEEVYVRQISALGFVPEMVVREADLEDAAKGTLDTLVAQGLTKERKGEVVLSSGNVRLYVPAQERYSCALLDACLYAQKLQLSDACVTVLPSQYSGQQRSTMRILQALGHDVSRIFHAYYEASGYELHPTIGEDEGVPCRQGEKGACAPEATHAA